MPHFFILSHGYNAGKPLKKCCPNCFVLQTSSESAKKILFWIVYCHWKAGHFIPLQVGSVVPVLHVNDVRNLINTAGAGSENKKFACAVSRLGDLSKLERLLQLQLRFIARTKTAIAKKAIADMLRKS
ncbi:hypothetical protein DQQ10_21385 [Pseudochryseolinea flava]|uniref:Uncharacterized protein n=2 Tax=Pseudochryseolinea flava TaxID=2059302 RepID=A0A364XXY7_9BACT|nr:hypothetical protein DQQ10_21385 [Pseudochryseolinea flava]